MEVFILGFDFFPSVPLEEPAVMTDHMPVFFAKQTDQTHLDPFGLLRVESYHSTTGHRCQTRHLWKEPRASRHSTNRRSVKRPRMEQVACPHTQPWYIRDELHVLAPSLAPNKSHSIKTPNPLLPCAGFRGGWRSNRRWLKRLVGIVQPSATPWLLRLRPRKGWLNLP